MLIIQTERMTVKTKYYVNNNGSHYFQRRIPVDLRSHFPKSPIRIKLTGSQSSIVAEIARHVRETDKMFADIRSQDPLERDAITLLSTYGLTPGAGKFKLSPQDTEYDDQPHLIELANDLEYKKSRGELTETDKLARQLLTRPLPLALSKTLPIYLQNHPKGNNPKFVKGTTQQCASVMKELGSMAIENITRSQVKDFIVKRSTEVTTGTVSRELSVIRSVMNVVIRERELDIKNPFLHQVIPNEGKDKKERQPFSIDELKSIIKSCLEKPGDITNIVLLCCLTGARLAEIAGLRRSDVYLEHKTPYISLVEHEGRSLKTKNSVRDVPLTPLAVDALSRHLKTHDGSMVFPQYNRAGETLSSNASGSAANLIKRLGIKEKTIHHARHTMRDLLRHADVPPHIIDSIGGWGSQSVGDSYGAGYSLDQKMVALTKAVNPLM